MNTPCSIWHTFYFFSIHLISSAFSCNYISLLYFKFSRYVHVKGNIWKGDKREAARSKYCRVKSAVVGRAVLNVLHIITCVQT